MIVSNNNLTILEYTIEMYYARKVKAIIILHVMYYDYCYYLPDRLYRQMVHKPLCGEPSTLENLYYYHNRLLNYYAIQFCVSAEG